jgi:hypothetical protein
MSDVVIGCTRAITPPQRWTAESEGRKRYVDSTSHHLQMYEIIFVRANNNNKFRKKRNCRLWSAVVIVKYDAMRIRY